MEHESPSREQRPELASVLLLDILWDDFKQSFGILDPIFELFETEIAQKKAHS